MKDYGLSIDIGFQIAHGDNPTNAYLNLYKIKNLYEHGTINVIELLYFDATQDMEKTRAFISSIIYDVMVSGKVADSTFKEFNLKGSDLEAFIGISFNCAASNFTFAEAWAMDQARIAQERKALESFLVYSVAAGTNYGYYNNKSTTAQERANSMDVNTWDIKSGNKGNSDAAGAGKNPLQGTQYTDKVLNQMAKGDYHGFPKIVDNYGSLGNVKMITGGDGITRTLLEIPGGYGGKEGVFQYIIEPNGMINHRVFVPNP